MAFLLYEKTANGKLISLGTSYALSGSKSGLIKKALNTRCNNSIVRGGYHLTSLDISNELPTTTTKNKSIAFLTDIHPKADHRIVILEITDIYAFVNASAQGQFYWCPMMLKMRYLIQHYASNCQKIKPSLIQTITPPECPMETIEFLYVTGDKWSWGKGGPVNATFIETDARAYFRTYF